MARVEDWRVAWAARRERVRVWGERMAAVDRDVDMLAVADAVMRHPAGKAFIPEHDPAVPVGCGCDSCQTAAQAVIDYWRERGKAMRAMQDARVNAWFAGQLDEADEDFLKEAQVAW